MKDNLLKIINHYGIKSQQKKLAEEVYEFQEAVADCESAYWYSPIQLWYSPIQLNKSYVEHVAEELADVTCMLKQFQYYYGITDEEVENIMKQKIERQLKRIEDEK